MHRKASTEAAGRVLKRRRVARGRRRARPGERARRETRVVQAPRAVAHVAPVAYARPPGRGEVLAPVVQREWLAPSAVACLFSASLPDGEAAVESADEMHITEPAPVSPRSARESISLPKSRESTANTIGGELTPEPLICRYFLSHLHISPIVRVGEVPGSNPGAPIDLRSAKAREPRRKAP